MSKIHVLIFAAILSLGGCATAESGRAFDTSSISSFVVGITTLHDVEASLGKPSMISHNSYGSTTIFYSHVESSANMFTGKSNVKINTATFDFNPAGILLDSRYTQ